MNIQLTLVVSVDQEFFDGHSIEIKMNSSLIALEINKKVAEIVQLLNEFDEKFNPSIKPIQWLESERHTRLNAISVIKQSCN
ncbi:hypothetical protein GVX76_10975 [[Haemophilus] felis]|nr:hypothetical protein [[Haemophilus] felis]